MERIRLLLDENLPIKLKDYFSDRHKGFMLMLKDFKWVGKKNGELFQLMNSRRI